MRTEATGQTEETSATQALCPTQQLGGIASHTEDTGGEPQRRKECPGFALGRIFSRCFCTLSAALVATSGLPRPPLKAAVWTASMTTACGFASIAARSASTFAICDAWSTLTDTVSVHDAEMTARGLDASGESRTPLSHDPRTVSLTMCRSYFGFRTESARSSTASGRCVLLVSMV